MQLPDEIQVRVGRVNRLLQGHHTVGTKLEAIAEVLERTIPACDSVSIALVLEEGALTGAASSQLAIEADLVQYAFNEGPCLVAIARTSVVRIDVLEQDDRFEHFAPGAIERGVESSLSIPLVAGDRVVGSFNLYSRGADAFDEATLALVAPIASYAAEVIAQSPLYAASLDLLEGLSVFIDQELHIARAIGAVIARQGVDEREALRLLVEDAAAADTSVLEVARRLVDSLGHDPSGPPAPGDGTDRPSAPGADG